MKPVERLGASVTAVATLGLLKAHAETNSAAGQKRIGVAMVDPLTARTPTYVADVTTPREPLRSSSSRMVLVAAGLVFVARAQWGAVAFTLGFFGVYFPLQWIEVGYVLAETKRRGQGGV